MKGDGIIFSRAKTELKDIGRLLAENRSGDSETSMTNILAKIRRVRRALDSEMLVSDKMNSFFNQAELDMDSAISNIDYIYYTLQNLSDLMDQEIIRESNTYYNGE